MINLYIFLLLFIKCSTTNKLVNNIKPIDIYYLTNDYYYTHILGNDTTTGNIMTSEDPSETYPYIGKAILTDLKTGKKYITLNDKYFLFEGKDTILRSKYWEDYNKK